MFFLHDYYGGGYGYDDRVDRRGWADKSEAAQRRENEATQLFHSFVQNTKSLPPTSFPHTAEVVPPHVHLTAACWSSFRKQVIQEGYTIKRREITTAEKNALSNSQRRNGKMYVISITARVHPDLALEEKVKKDEKARKAKERREEKAREKKEREEEERRNAADLERSLRQRTEQEYNQVIAMMKQQETVDSKVKTQETAFKNEVNVENQDEDKKRKANDDGTEKKVDDSAASPPKRIKAESEETKTAESPATGNSASAAPSPCAVSITITVPIERMYTYANVQHQKSIQDIHNQVYKDEQTEKARVMKEVEERFRMKRNQMIQEAEETKSRIRDVISKCQSGAHAKIM